MADNMSSKCGKCGFFLKRKNRHCKMIPGKGKKYCGEHSYLSEENKSSSGRKRIPCPLDTNHTVYEDQLKKHLKKCNVTKKRQVEYYQANINSGLANEMTLEEKLPLRKIPKADIQTCIKKLNDYFKGDPVQIKTSIFMEDGLQNEINKVNINLTLMKHLQQQSSLIGNLREFKLLTSDTVFIEFGAGRGMLSHWVQKAMADQTNVEFLLVDRASTRYKADSYHKGENQGPSFNRIQIDIEHLNLSKVPLISKTQQGITGISKHLCGAATDLALRCLLHTSHRDGSIDTEGSCTVDDKTHDNNSYRAKKRMKVDDDRVRGLLFALCCHHCCSWASYVGKEFLESLGFTPYYFHILCCLSSWATCGSRKVLSEGIETESELSPSEGGKQMDETEVEHCAENLELTSQSSGVTEEHGEMIDEGSCIKALGLSKSESEEIGRQSKHVLDAGRLWYLKKSGLDGALVYYIDRSVSLENVALLAWNTAILRS